MRIPPGAMRVVLITDGVGDVSRIREIVTAAVAGGLRAVQVREPGLSACRLGALCEQLRPMLSARRGVLLVNDRVDVAAAGCADGVHLAGHSLDPARARRVVGEAAVVGVSAHDANELRDAAEHGADYASLSPVFPTTCKPGAPHLGLGQTAELASRSPLPVVWLGGIDAARLAELAPLRPFGIAVMSALCRAEDPAAMAKTLCAAWSTAVAPAPRGLQ